MGIRVRTIHEIVVEGVAGAAPSGGPDQRLVRVRERRVHGVEDGGGLLPNQGVYHPPPEALQRETEAEDYVVRARRPQRAAGLEDAPRLLQPTDVPGVIRLEAPQRAVPCPLSTGARRPLLTVTPLPVERR